MNLSKTLLATALLPMLASAEQVTQTQNNEIQPDIVGGIAANPNGWKFYTQIVSRNGNRSFCGASYIGDGYVLTAAHCVDGDAPNQIAVKIGGVIYNGTDGVRSNVSQIYVHPSYNRSTLSHDIALLKLSSKPQGVTKVDIASGSVSQYAGVGDWLTVAGLGRTSEGAVHQPLYKKWMCLWCLMQCAVKLVGTTQQLGLFRFVREYLKVALILVRETVVVPSL